MSKRKKDPKLQALYDDENVNVYSISKLNAIDGCLREAYYTYGREIEDRGVNNIYGIMGSKIHDTLELIYNDEANGDALLPALKSELEDAEMLNVDFPKDAKGGTLIKDNWITDMTHFCNNFEKMEGEFITEELVILKISEKRYLIGYIDLIQVVDEERKIINIYDFKTSTKFKKTDMLHHGRQLVVYAMAMEELGYKINELAWIMLKYVDVTYEWYARSNSKNKSTITKMVQRCKLAKELSGNVEMMLYEKGYDEIDIEILLNMFKESNSLDVLPREVADQFKISQSMVYYDYTDEVKDEAIDYINSRADTFESLLSLGESDWTPVEINEKQIFYCSNLCSHRDICEELEKYKLSQLLMAAEDDDLF